MGRKWIKRIMAGAMLCAIYLLSREGAVLTAQEKNREFGSNRYRQRTRRD